MKRFSINVAAQNSKNSAQTAQKAHNAKSNKKRKKDNADAVFPWLRSGRSAPVEFETFELFSISVNVNFVEPKKQNSSSYTISNRRMKAYRKVFNWKCNNNQLRVDMLKHVESHGGAQPASWTSTSQVGLSM